MKRAKAFVKHLTLRPYLLGGVVLIILVTVGVFAFSGNGKVETVSLVVGDLDRTVKVAGKVVPKDKVDLSFEVAGIVAAVGKDVGDSVSRGQTLVSLNTSGVLADLGKAEAGLASAQAELSKLEGSSAYESTIVNAKRSLTQSILSAYTTAADAILNKVDQVFYDPRNRFVAPSLSGFFGGYTDLRTSVENTRLHMTYLMEDWQKLIANLSDSNLYTKEQLDGSKQYLDEVTAFVSNVYTAVGHFEANEQMSQATIDGFKDDVRTAKDNLNTATKDLITKENSLASYLADVPVQVASVEAAQATVDSLRYNLSKTSLTSPIDGVVSKQDAKVGETVAVGESLVSVISPDYLVEVYVPEISIVGIKVGDEANITLDAYGKDTIFLAKVDSIDPAETIRDGVSTYKVKLAFVTADPRIRSGMTANIVINTFHKSNVAMIPERAVMRDGAETFVYVVNGGQNVKRDVVLGERDLKGNVEVVSGLTQSEQVLLNPAQ